MSKLNIFVSVGLLLIFLHSPCVYSAKIELIVDGNIVEIDVEPQFLGFLTEFAKIIVESADTDIKIDVNECANNQTHTCNLTTEKCVNADGTFFCPCKPEYVRLTENASCVEDLCFKSNIICNVSRVCNQDPSNLSCVCAPGFQDNGTACGIITPCFPNNCPSNSHCDSTGSQSVCTCNIGFTGFATETVGSGSSMSGGSGSIDDIECIDIDECSTGVHNCDTTKATCQNLDGSFNCSCKNGYVGNGVICADIDECVNNAICDFASTSDCNNFEGGFDCSCNMGFEHNTDDLSICFDIDECQMNIHSCPDNSTCKNDPGTFTCNCNTGYEKQGNLCKDIDECLTDNSCPDHSTCNNTEGGYLCHCKVGFEKNGTLCEDVDECATTCRSTTTSTCTNTDGGYECACNDGYVDFGNNECIGGAGVIPLQVTVTSRSARRRKRATDGFTDSLQIFLSNLLAQYGHANADVNVTIVSKIDNPDNSTTYELIISADPEVRQFLDGVLADIQGPIDNFEIEEIFYPVSSKFAGSSDVSSITNKSPSQLCQELEDFVLNKLNASNSVTNGTTFECNGNVTGDTFVFDVVLDGAYAGLFNFSEVISDFNTFIVESRAVCDASSCLPSGNCVQHFGSIQCTCRDNSLYDSDITKPGTTCISPILPLQCYGNNSAVISLYLGYFIDLGLDPNTIRLLDSTCTGTQIGPLLIFNTEFDTCDWNSAFDNTGNILYTNNVTNTINGAATNQLTISFPVTCSYSKIFSTNDDNEDPVAISVLSATVIVQNAQNTGTLSATVMAYEDANLATALTPSNVLSIGQEIYIHASHSASTANNFMKLETCWMTPTTDPNDAQRNELITNACSADSTLVNIISNGDQEYATFKLFVRQFIGYSAFYIHCDIEVCSSQCQATCSTGPSGRRRRDTGTNSDTSNTATIGPLNTVDNGDQTDNDETEDPDSPIESAGGAVNVTAVVVGVIFALLAVVAVALIVYMKHKRDSGYSSSYN